MSVIAGGWGGTQHINRRDLWLAGVISPLVFNLAATLVLEIWPESGGGRVSGYTWSQQV